MSDTTTVYSGRVTNWPLVIIATALAVVLAAFSGLSRPDFVGLAIVAAAVLIVDLVMTSVRTTAGPNGVVVRYGVLGFPRFRFAAADIASAEAVDVSFAQMGGWGIHWSPWRGTRLTIRSGPALRLTLTSGRKVTISAAAPDTAAAVLNRRVAPQPRA